MEDISRELERELKNNLKPKPFKPVRKKRVIIVDDFGEMTSGEWIKKVCQFLLIATILLAVATGTLYYLYAELKAKSADSTREAAELARQVSSLNDEKEVLMARLVILQKGNTDAVPAGDADVPKSEQPPAAETAASSKAPETEPTQTKAIPESTPEAATKTEAAATGSVNESTDMVSDKAVETPIEAERTHLEKTVSIEKFKVLKDGQNQDLLVRFDIRNVSEQPGDVAGYIFTVLWPDTGDASEDAKTNEWLVVPTTTLERGIPTGYKKGQYFSIAHYKPVKFRIKNQSRPDFFTKASIFVFNTKGELIFEKLIDITEAE